MSAVEKDVHKIRISSVTPELVDSVWEQLGSLIDKGMTHSVSDRATSDHMRARVKSGQALMWAAHRGTEYVCMVVVGIHDYPAKKMVCVEFLAGKDSELWQDDIENLLSDFKDLIGAQGVEAYCRKGAVPKMDRWQQKAVLMELK